MQQQEKELARRKEKEAELLTFSEKLSSSNAELQAAKTSLESQVSEPNKCYACQCYSKPVLKQ